MPAWFGRLTGKAAPPPSPLALRLQAYPPYDAPHAGPASNWTLQQAEDNLNHLLAHREQRLQLLGALLREQGIDPAPALAGGDCGPLLGALWQWSLREWPALRGPKMPERGEWLASTRRGAQIAYSLLMDLSLLLGELIVRRRASIQWGLDLDESSRRDDMQTYRRPMLLVDRQAAGREPFALDIEDIAVSRYRYIDSPTQGLVDEWARVVNDAVSGAYER
jgi:hypothetical protein